MSQIRKRSPREIFSRNQSRTAPALLTGSLAVLHNIRSLYNVGSAFRTADALGLSGLILSGYTPVPPRPEITKTALGAEETVQWVHFDTIGQTLEHLRSQHYILIGIEQTDNSQLLPEFRWPEEHPVAVFFGNEVTGLDNDLLQHIHHFVEIPQFGEKHSFNISVSFGIVLYDMCSRSYSFGSSN
jgi:23S rRNA (guanosine2251-2'-O)-methyltransferase